MKKALTLALMGALAVAPAWAAGGSQQRSEMQDGQYQSSPQQQQQSLNQDTVRQLQEQLQSQGYQVGEVDGVLGPRTQQALTSFQRDQNLQATGRPDQQTMAALGIESDSQQAEIPQNQRQRGQDSPSEQEQQSR
jgi:peptidoglycan hydrolase-like protein with peptidoglycan-binding domain